MPPAYTEEQVVALLKGDAAPWDGEAGAGAHADSAGRKIALGRRLHVKGAERDRTLEELAWLRAEVRRLVFALGATRDRISDWLEKNGRGRVPGAPGLSASAAPATPPLDGEDADAEPSVSGSEDGASASDAGDEGLATGFCYWAWDGEGDQAGGSTGVLGAKALVLKYGGDSEVDGKECVLRAQLARITGLLDECKTYGWEA